jgi:alpha-L-fucosidase
MPDILENRPLPTWYDDAKFGIMVHWTPSSVPAFAPRSGRVWDVPDHMRDNPYVEWYYNSLKIDGSPVQAFHREHYGAGYPYERFADEFKRVARAADFAGWASLFAQAGAKYVVPVTRHHDGFCLWPSAWRNPHIAPDYRFEHDAIGALGDAVRGRGMRYGLYYSGGIDWSWHDQLIRTMADLGKAVPRDPAYLDYAFGQWVELIDRYEPACLWNDIYMPGPSERVEALFRYYLQRVPDGVINDRYRTRPRAGGGFEPGIYHDFTTPEYTVESGIRAKKWECVRGIGHSFGYNREEGEEDYMSPRALIHLLIDIVSKGGNLLLNVGPMADGTIPEMQARRLRALGAWLAANGEAIYGTRPWRAPGVAASDGTEVRFTARAGTVYVHILGVAGEPLVLPGVQLRAGPGRLLASGAPVECELRDGATILRLRTGGVDASVVAIAE